MPAAAPIQPSFNAGELSPLLYGRTDFAKFASGLSLCENLIAIEQGAVTARPGTYFAAEVKTSSKLTRLLPFEFSTAQAYIIELGDQYFRFYKNNGQILSGGSPYEVANPYLEADLNTIKITQSADVLYLAHTSYAPRKLSRTSDTNWTLSTIDFLDGPYLPVNTETANTMTPSGVSGSITLTMVNDTFVSTDAGRLIRFFDSGSNWTWLKITAFTDAKHVTATVMGADLASTTASADWRLGAWSATTGYPGAVTFVEDRLTWGGGVNTPQRIDASVTGDYENMAPSDPDGTVADDNALSFTLNSNTVNSIHWIEGAEAGIYAGTSGGEWLIRPSTFGEALSPTNILAKQSSNHGSENYAASRAGKGVLFVQFGGKKIRAITYSEESGLKASNVTILSNHILGGGVAAPLAYQKEPIPITWAPRADGQLVGLTYSEEQEVVGWHRHVIGGVSDALGTAAKVESVAVIPSIDGTYSELWLVVQRYVNGAVTRHVEYLTNFWEEADGIENAFFLDCALTYSGAPTISISGLDHLEGETVSILADGSPQPDKTVSSGAITLDFAAGTVHVGYGHNCDGKTLRYNAGAANGTAQGKTKRIDKVGFLLHETVGLQFGDSFDELDTETFRMPSDPMGEAVPPFSGIKMVDWPGGYDYDGYICFRQAQPLPFTLLALMPQGTTYD